MSFPDNSTLIDNFNRASLGANWTLGLRGWADLVITGNTQLTGTSGAWSAGFYNVATYGPDVDAFVDYVSGADSGEIYARLSGGTTPNGYGTYHEAGSFSSIFRLDAGASTTLGATFTNVLSAGDKFGLEIIGSIIKAYKYTGGSWAEVASRSDATYAGAGYIGVDCYTNSQRLDNLSGGTAGGAPPPSTHGYKNRFGEERIQVPLFQTGKAILDAVLTDWFFGPQPITGTLAITLDAMSLTATGTVQTGGGVTGDLSVTLDAIGLTADGSSTIAGAANIQLADATLAAAGSAPITGMASVPLADATLAAAGVLPVVGVASDQLADATLAAAGVAPEVGALQATLGDASLSAAGVAPVVGAASIQLGGVSLSATGSTGSEVTGNLSVQLGDVGLSAAGVVPVSGSAAVALDDVVLSSAGVVPVSGAASITLDSAVASAAGSSPISAAASLSLDDVGLVADGAIAVPNWPGSALASEATWGSAAGSVIIGSAEALFGVLDSANGSVLVGMAEAAVGSLGSAEGTVEG